MHEVVCDVGGGVTQMGGVVGRDPAHIDANDVADVEIDDLADDRIEESHRAR